MPVTIPTTEPLQFRSGLTVVWEKSDFSNYPYADGYTIAKYTINGQNGSKTITGAYSNGTWTFTLSASNNDLAEGTYTLFGFVQDGDGNKYEIYNAALQIKENLVTETQTDTRSHIKKVLDAIEAVMENRATKVQESQSLPNGIAISMLKPEELVKWYETYQYKYQQELDSQRLTNGGTRRKLRIQFQ